MAGQYSAGTFLRARQFDTALWTTPRASPSWAVPPTSLMARSSACILPFKHERDCPVNTNVRTGLITGVKEDLDTIAKRLAHARLEKQLSQAQLATSAGVSQGTIGNIEAGIRLSKQSLPMIAEALGISLHWLRDGKGPMLPEDGAVELEETDFAMLTAFKDMSDEDRQIMLKDAMGRAESFKRLAKEVIRKHTSVEVADKDAFQPKHKPPSEVYKKKAAAKRRIAVKKGRAA